MILEHLKPFGLATENEILKYGAIYGGDRTLQIGDYQLRTGKHRIYRRRKQTIGIAIMPFYLLFFAFLNIGMLELAYRKIRKAGRQK